MQQQEDWDLKCPRHKEKIISVQLTDSEKNNMFCIKCLTEKQLSLQQLAQQLSDMRQRKIKKLVENGIKRGKRLEYLKKLFLTIKEQFTQSLDSIIATIDDEITQMNTEIKLESKCLSQPIQKLNFSQVNIHIKELREEYEQTKNESKITQDIQLRNMMITKYLELVKQLNQLIKQRSDWNIIEDDSKNAHINDDSKNNQEENKVLVPQFKKIGEIITVDRCYAIATDKDEKILINGYDCDIQVWDISSDGNIKLKQFLKGHTHFINVLCFSSKALWFISGSWDRTIRIWQINDFDKWVCIQILNDAHFDYVQRIILSKEEDQFISCGLDNRIKVWMKYQQIIQWDCVQQLIDHQHYVLFLSFNSDFNLLASSGKDALIIWQKGEGKKWVNKQKINNPEGDYHLRIAFIEKNELIASTFEQGSLLRYTQNSTGLYELKSVLYLNSIDDQHHYFSPLIFNQSQRLVILRHSDYHTYILKQQDNGEFIIHQDLQNNYKASCFSKNGRYLILYNDKSRHLEVITQ